MAHTVLIVDDSLTVRMDLDEAFRGAGLATTLCATGEQARAALAADRYDVAVLDVLLPDADGVDLLRGMRADTAHADTIILLLSTEAEVTDRLHGLRTGADEYLGKPYDAGYVIARTRQLLSDRSAPDPERATVLVIDDSRTYRELLRKVLAEAGYAVLAAASGEEGLRIAADRRPSAIVVDNILPGIDGATVIRRVRLDAALRDVPCVLFTAADDGATELRTLEAGADAVVRKQDDLSVVLATLGTILRDPADYLPIPSAGSMHGPTKLLLIDTDRDRLQGTAEALRGGGHEVVLADRTDDALALLAAQPVDCVVLDGQVPGVDSGAVVANIRALPELHDVPIVVLGDRADPDALVRCLAAGADHYVGRDEGPELLRANIRSQIRRRRSQDKARRIREELLRGEIEAAEARAARELAAARAELVEKLEWRNEELDAFTGSVTHDLRSPLQVIGGLAEMLIEDELESLSPAGQHRIQRIHAASLRMSDMVDSLLLLSRASRAELRREPVDLTALAREIVEELRGRDPDRAVDVRIADGMVAPGDPGLLRVVLANLIGNAWKFTGRAAAPLIEVGSTERGAETAYWVRDNGAGFPGADAERIFRPFQRMHAAEDFPGTGIGLTTVHRILDRHAGRIRADSEVGRGATFTFTLPHDAPAAPPPDQAGTQPHDQAEALPRDPAGARSRDSVSAPPRDPAG
ncbi:hypothetical protein GCM10010123_06080 [Pilimelia anulata]|uniref:Sensor-like histidine kinase SenX3 n=1 Tax=Pilimelia anulata TaxID=53371 RepID=A0A8J3F7I6_9ACTN|nr:response regulator [Pilimelia anulata]GGJ78949.1 hypothetical protein GCM10010123_06080 [Pilimelia anulata]